MRCKLDILITAKITLNSVLANSEFWSNRYSFSRSNSGNDQPENDFWVQQVWWLSSIFEELHFKYYNSTDLLFLAGQIAVKRLLWRICGKDLLGVHEQWSRWISEVWNMVDFGNEFKMVSTCLPIRVSCVLIMGDDPCFLIIFLLFVMRGQNFIPNW